MFLAVMRLVEMFGAFVHIGRHTDRFRIIAYVVFGMLDFFGYRGSVQNFVSVRSWKGEGEISPPCFMT